MSEETLAALQASVDDAQFAWDKAATAWRVCPFKREPHFREICYRAEAIYDRRKAKLARHIARMEGGPTK